MAEIRVNGREYELASLDDVTLGEARIVQKYTGQSLDKITDGVDVGVLSALVHITIARAEPGETAETIQAVVDAMSFIDLLEQLNEEADDESIPPPNETSNAGSSNDSGASSSPTGEPPPENNQQNGSGSRGSAIGATSAQGTWGT